jgi:hypothetical protein
MIPVDYWKVYFWPSSPTLDYTSPFQGLEPHQGLFTGSVVPPLDIWARYGVTYSKKYGFVFTVQR